MLAGSIALKIIERDTSPNGLYKGQMVTDCVIAKVRKGLVVTRQNRLKEKYGNQ